MIQNAFLTLIGVVFCALAIMMLVGGDPEDRLLAVGCLCFFGGCVLIGASLLRADLRKPKPLDAASTVLTIYYDRWFHFSFGLASWGMTAGAVMFALRAPLMWLTAGPALVLFGLGGALLLSRAFQRNAVILISPDGVIDHRVMSRPAPWAEIESAGFPYLGPGQNLQIVLRDATPFRRRRKGLFAWTGHWAVKGHTILITLRGLNADPAQILAAIAANKPDMFILGEHGVLYSEDQFEDGIDRYEEGPDTDPKYLHP